MPSAIATALASIVGVNGWNPIFDYTVSVADKDSIDTFVDGTPVASFAGYTDLEILALLRSDDVGAASNYAIVCNNDTSALYDIDEVGANNITAQNSAALGQANWSIVGLHGGGGSADFAAVSRIKIPFPNDTNFFKSAIIEAGVNDGTLGNNWSLVYQATYRSKPALTRLKFAPLTAGKKFKVGSRIAIFGRLPASILSASSTGLLAVRKNVTGGFVSTTGTSLSDVDAANSFITFVAPVSGNVLIRVVGTVGINISSGTALWGLREGTTNIAGPMTVMDANSNHVHRQVVSWDAYITGLTPGSSHTYKLAQAISGTGSPQMWTYQSATDPVTMEAWAAP
jgi:hypothetical protein